MPNTKSVAHFLLIELGGDLLVVLVLTGGKQSQLLVPFGTWSRTGV